MLFLVLFWALFGDPNLYAFISQNIEALYNFVLNIQYIWNMCKKNPWEFIQFAGKKYPAYSRNSSWKCLWGTLHRSVEYQEHQEHRPSQICSVWIRALLLAQADHGVPWSIRIERYFASKRSPTYRTSVFKVHKG